MCIPFILTSTTVADSHLFHNSITNEPFILPLTAVTDSHLIRNYRITTSSLVHLSASHGVECGVDSFSWGRIQIEVVFQKSHLPYTLEGEYSGIIIPYNLEEVVRNHPTLQS